RRKTTSETAAIDVSHRATKAGNDGKLRRCTMSIFAFVRTVLTRSVMKAAAMVETSAHMAVAAERPHRRNTSQMTAPKQAPTKAITSSDETMFNAMGAKMNGCLVVVSITMPRWVKWLDHQSVATCPVRVARMPVAG